MSSDLNKKVINDGDLSILANNLRRLMHDANIDSSELSKRTGIALTTVNGLRRGVGNPTLSTLYQLAEFFDVTVGQLAESNISKSTNKLKQTYEVPLLSIDELTIFLSDKSKFKDTITTEIESWKQDSYYAIKINNSAMSPLFEKGTIFVLSQDSNVYDGDIALVQFDKQNPCFRKIFIEGSSYFFKPVSEAISDNPIKIDNFIIHGIVIKAIQHFHN